MLPVRIFPIGLMAFAASILAACAPAALPPSSVFYQGETPNYEEVQRFEIDNCTGKADLTRTEARELSVNVTISEELAASVGASAEVVSAEVEQMVGQSLGSAGSRATTINVTAPPSTRMFFELVWTGPERIGVVQNYRATALPVVFRSFFPADVRIRSQYDLGCPTPIVPADTPESALQPVQQNLPQSASQPSVQQYNPPASLTSCGAFAKGETRNLEAGTFIVGDVIVDAKRQYDWRTMEGTVVYLEKDAAVTSEYGAACYRGELSLLSEVVQGEFEHGCEPGGCTKARVVIVRSSGQQEVTCLYRDGSAPQQLQVSGADTWCP